MTLHRWVRLACHMDKNEKKTTRMRKFWTAATTLRPVPHERSTKNDTDFQCGVTDTVIIIIIVRRFTKRTSSRRRTVRGASGAYVVLRKGFAGCICFAGHTVAGSTDAMRRQPCPASSPNGVVDKYREVTV